MIDHRVDDLDELLANDAQAFELAVRYRVDDLNQPLADLRPAGVEILKGPESCGNGEFAWIGDPEGNKVELWDPRPWDEKNKVS